MIRIEPNRKPRRARDDYVQQILGVMDDQDGDSFQ